MSPDPVPTPTPPSDSGQWGRLIALAVFLSIVYFVCGG